MLCFFLHTFVFLLFVFVGVASRNQQNSILRIYSNLAEVIEPVDKLPLEFIYDDWNYIRSDSITLIGENINITSQSITEKLKSLNGAEVYVRSPISFDKTATMFVKATIVDEERNLVKIQDQSVSPKEVLYFTVSSQDIFYMEEPSYSKFYVNFTYTKITNSKIYVSYLQSSINWLTQYQLNLYNTQSELIAMANIRNNGKSSVSVEQAELFSGDINLRMQNEQLSYSPSYGKTDILIASGDRSMRTESVPNVRQSDELMGVHVFAIDKSFVIDGQTNYLLPMFRSQIKVERYNSISNSFSGTSISGKTQRSYRLKSDRYLSQGNCIIRENDRVVGETFLPNLAAKNKHEFSIGQDSEVIYEENVTLISTKQFREEASNISYAQVHTRFVYSIHVQVKNFKNRSVKIEYTKRFYSTTLKLIRSTNDLCVQVGSVIKSKMTINANDEQVFSYKIEFIS